MGNIRMIVTDLDRTLLRKDKTVSEYTEAVFQKYHDRGVKIVFATARPIRTVNSLNLNIPADAAIYHNGAVITMAGNLYRHIGIGYETAKRILLQASKRFKDMQISVEMGDMLYANFDVTKVWKNTTGVMTDFLDLPPMPADKIIFGTVESREIEEIQKMLDDDLYSEITENLLLMVMNKNARKRGAIQEIAAYNGFSLTDVAAFGDDHNDVEMLRACGVGVAVANAIGECKAAADYICDTNDNDGVAKWLDERL